MPSKQSLAVIEGEKCQADSSSPPPYTPDITSTNEALPTPRDPILDDALITIQEGIIEEQVVVVDHKLSDHYLPGELNSTTVEDHGVR